MKSKEQLLKQEENMLEYHSLFHNWLNELETNSKKSSLVIRNEQALIDAGFYKKVIDTDFILNSFNDGLYHELILQNAFIRQIEG